MDKHEQRASRAFEPGESNPPPTVSLKSEPTPTLPHTSLSLTDLNRLFAPAEITVPSTAPENLVEVLTDTIFYLESDEPELYDNLEELMRHIATGEPLTRALAASVTPKHGDVAIREVLTISTLEGKERRSTSVEFELLHPQSNGLVLTVAPGTEPETVKASIGWRGNLEYQSSFSIERRWELLSDLMPMLTELDPAEAAAVPVSGAPHRYALSDGLQFDVLPRNERYADLLNDPHLAVRPDLVHLCALRARFEEDEERLELDERIGHLYRAIAKLCPDLSIREDFEDAVYSREALAACGAVPFLAGSDKELEAIVVDNFILIATRESTGHTLLKDLAELELISAAASTVALLPQLNRIVALDVGAPTPPLAANLFKLLELPDRENFIAALSDFVAYENIEYENDLFDGLLDPLRLGNSVTIALERHFFVEGTGVADPRSAEPREPWALPAWESEEDPDNVTLSRVARITPAVSNGWAVTPSIVFTPPAGGTAAEALRSPFVGEEPTLRVEMLPNRRGETQLPEGVARQGLRLLGQPPGPLSIIAAEDDPTSGERAAYLSDSLRVHFKL